MDFLREIGFEPVQDFKPSGLAIPYFEGSGADRPVGDRLRPGKGLESDGRAWCKRGCKVFPYGSRPDWRPLPPSRVG